MHQAALAVLAVSVAFITIPNAPSVPSAGTIRNTAALLLPFQIIHDNLLISRVIQETRHRATDH